MLRKRGLMKLQLCILKSKVTKDQTTKRFIRFAIVDQDRKERYPANFVCILPQHMSSSGSDSSIFAKTFREKHIEMAKKLLNDALRIETDPQIKKEITERLRQLVPKPN